MLGLSELKQTKVYQEAFEEGLAEGERRGLQEGLVEGLAEGKRKAKLESIPRLLALGLSLEQIAQALALDLEQVRQAASSKASNQVQDQESDPHK